MQVEVIQSALVRAGFQLGQTGPKHDGADGAWGARSIAAARAFQTAKGLPPTGVIDSSTLAALFPKVLVSVSPPWHAELLRLKGLREGAGASDNPVILGWAKKLGIWFPHDSIAWCGLMQAHVIRMTLPDEAIPNNPLGARNWSQFGVPCAPMVGAIMVFWRGSKKSGLGHVGQYLSETANAFKILGGNQQDSVSETWIAKERFVDARWPSTYPKPANSGPQVAGSTGQLSNNEA